MLWKQLRKQRGESGDALSNKRGSLELQIILWSLWTLAVATTAYLNWHADIAAQRPINLLSLIIHSALVGIIGLVVMTLVEMHVEPWRFIDEE